MAWDSGFDSSLLRTVFGCFAGTFVDTVGAGLFPGSHRPVFEAATGLPRLRVWPVGCSAQARREWMDGWMDGFGVCLGCLQGLCLVRQAGGLDGFSI